MVVYFAKMKNDQGKILNCLALHHKFSQMKLTEILIILLVGRWEQEKGPSPYVCESVKPIYLPSHSTLMLLDVHIFPTRAHFPRRYSLLPKEFRRTGMSHRTGNQSKRFSASFKAALKTEAISDSLRDYACMISNRHC